MALQPGRWALKKNPRKSKADGAREQQVGELESAASKGFVGFGAITTLVFEFEAYPEPKYLKPNELRQLIAKYGTHQTVANVIGACEAFVRQNTKI